MKNETVYSRIFDVINVIFFALLSITFLYPVFYIVSVSLSEAKAITEGRVFAWPVGFNFRRIRYTSRTIRR
jgi:ABC-type glycerol-3-phosphate transport system permease component